MTSQVKVFQVRTARDDFRHLAIDHTKVHSEIVSEVAFALDCKGIPKPDWSPPPVHMANPLKPEPDFWGTPAGGAFGIHPRALPIVSMFLDRAGEMLPLPFKGMTFQVLNILAVYDCIDEDKSEWRTRPSTGEKYSVRKPYFVPGHFDASTLFKIPTSELDIFCWEYNRDPEEEFKACVEQNKLMGLKFELIWSEDKGILR